MGVPLQPVSLPTAKALGSTQSTVKSSFLADRCATTATTAAASCQSNRPLTRTGHAQASLRSPPLRLKPSGFDSCRLRQPSFDSVARVASVSHGTRRSPNRRSAVVGAFLQHHQASSGISPPPSVNNSPSTSIHSSSTDPSAVANDYHSLNTNHATSANTNTNNNTNSNPATFASVGQISSSSNRHVEPVSHGGYPSATSASRPTASQHMASISAAPPIRMGAEGAPIDFPVLCLGFVACSITAALSVMLVAAVPALLAIRKAAQALERLAEVAREEVPGTMAAVRLSGMEMSDLSMELSDLSQEISQGIRNSARAVRLAEDGLRRVGSLAASRTA
ncbi:unnamed protein product, partial [Closterium sp. NIES-53]